jgi:ribosomal 50S subunit-associated protein YjgA (DUF615 family)
MIHDQLLQLVKLAARVSDEAPLRRNKSAVSAYVRWRTVEEIRTLLAQAGIDWRAAHNKGA